MLSANASSSKMSLRKPIVAVPMKVTPRPQSNGTAAAIGERNTISSRMISTGKAISSPLSSESSDAWLSARTSGVRPDTSEVTGG